MADMTKIAEMKQDICAFLQGKQGKVCVSFYDLNAGEGFSIRGTERVPSASTIKLVILAEAMRRVRERELSLEQTITVTEEMRTGGDGILKELLPGHTFTLREILTLMIIVSDNEATNILIRMLGMDSVNRMASELGLKEACLGRLMMDSEAKKQGRDNYICADDMTEIFRQIYAGQCVGEEESRLMMDILRRQQQGGRLQLYLPEEIETAHKCGDLDALENDGGIIFLPGRPYILTVLTSEMESNKEGREVIGHISRIVFDALS